MKACRWPRRTRLDTGESTQYIGDKKEFILLEDYVKRINYQQIVHMLVVLIHLIKNKIESVSSWQVTHRLVHDIIQGVAWMAMHTTVSPPCGHLLT